MAVEPLKFLIIVTGYNCSKFVENCINSLRSQKYKNFDVVLISDGSTDQTAQVIERLCPAHPNWHIEIPMDNRGAAYRRFMAIKQYAKTEETVCLLLGMDDELLNHGLTRIEQEYKQKGVWMTYGNWRNQHNKRLPDGFLQFDEATHETRNYRKVKYRSTAPNTFKRFLFDQLTEEDFKLDGKWIDSTTESALMFACLEMCGKERIGVIENVIYLYNEFLPGGTLRRLGRGYKYEILKRIMAREKKPLLIR